MKRGIPGLSSDETQVVDELMLPTGVFGATLVAGVLCLALIWDPHVLFSSRAASRASIALRNAHQLTVAKTMRLSGREPGEPTVSSAE